MGALEAHAVSLQGRPRTFNSTAQGRLICGALHAHPYRGTASRPRTSGGFGLSGTHLGVDARDYRDCDFTGPTAFVLGAEKWGLTDAARDGMDEALFIPMRGMVQSLNVSVATATLLFEALRQRQAAGLAPTQGEGLTPEHYRQLLFEWSYPQVAAWCQREGRPYPALSEEGELLEELPRNVKLRC